MTSPIPLTTVTCWQYCYSRLRDGFCWPLLACFPTLETPDRTSSHLCLVPEVYRTQPWRQFLFKCWHLFVANIHFEDLNSPRWWPVSRGHRYSVEKSYPLVSTLDIDGEWGEISFLHQLFTGGWCSSSSRQCSSWGCPGNQAQVLYLHCACKQVLPRCKNVFCHLIQQRKKKLLSFCSFWVTGIQYLTLVCINDHGWCRTPGLIGWFVGATDLGSF